MITEKSFTHNLKQKGRDMINELALFGGQPYIKDKINHIGVDIQEEIIEKVIKTLKLNSLSYFSNPIVQEFEREFNQKLKAEHAIATSSGTASIHAAVLALKFKKGDEVILPSYTYIASLNPLLLHGIRPVFVDIDLDTCNMNLERLQEAISPRTKAILAVHVFGNMCDIDGLLDIAHDKRLLLIEDCAQALGAKFKGKYLGTFGDIGCFSFFENKHLTTGEGGMLITNDSKLSIELKKVINEGEYCEDGTPSISHYNPPFKYSLVGLNYRMSAITASIGIPQIQKIDENVKKRAEIISRYRKYFSDCEYFKFYFNNKNKTPSYFVFNTLFQSKNGLLSRDAFLRLLNSEGVPAMRYYPKSLHSFFNTDLHLSNTEFVSQHNICFPCNLTITEKNVMDIRGAVDKIMTILLENKYNL